jgi:hypothetical protein
MEIKRRQRCREMEMVRETEIVRETEMVRETEIVMETEMVREMEIVRETYMEMVKTEIAEGRWRYRDNILCANCRR